MKIFSPLALATLSLAAMLFSFAMVSFGSTADVEPMPDPLLALLIEVGIADASLAE